ncbi:hypothetical protein BASA81_017225 [Batrachochytrium salamandrivorans]|nr:hypothetical protein BASA81_017225 [Batrachochytrium salamandrivorans]
MANSDISFPSVDHRQEPSHLPTFSIYRLSSRLDIIPPLHSRSNPGSTRWSMSPDRPRTTKHGARFRITVPEDRHATSSSASSAKASKRTGVFGKNYRHRRPDQTRPTAPPPPLSRQILAVNVANISNKRPCYPPYVRKPGSGPSHRPASPHLNFRFTVPGFDVHPASSHWTWTQRNSPSVSHRALGGHEHGSAVGTMILAKTVHTTPDTDTDIHQLTSQFLESANAVADNLSLRLSPPATRSNRRLLSGTTKRAILASNTARQAFIAAATHTNPDPVQCNTLRDEWSRLKAAAPNSREWMVRKQWVKHADNLDRAVSDGRTDLVFSAARAMSGNSFPLVLQSLHCTTPMA